MMRGIALIGLFGVLLLPGSVGAAGPAGAGSENDKLACVKEVPNPYGLAMRQHYVLTCRTKTDGLTVVRISANDGACACRVYGATERMRAKARFMSRCTMGTKPCDFTEVTFETDAGDIVFTWDPVEVWDPKEFNLEFR